MPHSVCPDQQGPLVRNLAVGCLVATQWLWRASGLNYRDLLSAAKWKLFVRCSTPISPCGAETPGQGGHLVVKGGVTAARDLTFRGCSVASVAKCACT